MKPFTVLSFVSFSALALFAQTTPPNTSANSSGGVLVGVIGAAPSSVVSYSPSFVSSIGPGAPGGVVTGAPYSAEQVTEHVQTLADGTHITQPTQTTKLYRDSAGRTRTERSFPLPPGALSKGSGAPSFIEIFDPVSGARYTLEPQNHTARTMSMPSPPPPPLPPATANSVPVSRTVRLLPAQLPAQSGPTPQEQTPRPQFSRESLGTRTIEGVLAEGSRTTVTYPIGAVGNDRPISTTIETWTSPELKMAVLSKNSDPRNGESTTRLTNISRLEPDLSLFQIPADYEIIEPQTAVKQ